MASAATSSSDPPLPALMDAATAPSMSGAATSRTVSGSSSPSSSTIWQKGSAPWSRGP